MELVSKHDNVYEVAPSKLIPPKQIFVIEYPGYAKNTDKVLRTLGGEKGLRKAVNEDLMELRFRPDDPFCHPINGDVIPTSNLLLKVTRCKKKCQNDNASRENKEKVNVKENVKFDILGIISKTCRFRGMSDYQYVPNMKHPILEYRKALESLDVNKIMDSESIINNVKEENNLPPPSFSRVECPMDYGYQQNTAVVKVLVKKDDGQPPSLKLINRSRRKRFIAISITCDIDIVPEEPPQESLRNIEQMPLESINRIRELFKKRPIWTRLALENKLPSIDKRNIKRLLPLVAYLMSNGPWRDCWICYGYDPRLNQEARFYQLLDIRNTRRPTKLGRAKRLLHIQEDATAEKDNIENSNNDLKTSHVFDGTLTCRDVAVFQMCDITDPLLERLIKSPDSVQEFFDEHDGFYKHSELIKMRKVMRRKFKALTEGKTLNDDEDFDDLLNAHDDESENEDGGDEDEEISSEPKDDQVINRVNDLMRNLQVMKRSQKDFEQDDEGTFDSFEDLDNSDMFEENGSEDIEVEGYDDFDN